MSGESTDKEILSLIANPSTEQLGFKLLYSTYSKRLYWHIRNMVQNHDDADDLLQDVLVKAWKGLKRFRADSAIYTWLYRIASNECITFLKKKNKAVVLSLNSDENKEEGKLKSDENIDGIKLLATLQKALDTLPEKQRQVFCMRYYDEMTYQDISEKLGTTVGSLKASYHHAVIKVEKFFKDND